MTNQKHFIVIAVIMLWICGCMYRKPLNLTIAKERVEQYYECGQYEKDLNKVISRVRGHFEKVSTQQNATIIFDVDDTALSDYADAKSISFGYIPKLSREWVLRADAPAIPQTKCLYDYLAKRGFTIIFLTGRKHDEYIATIKNLKEQGFATFDRLIVRQKNEEQLTAQEYKASHRQQLVKQGYRIVGCIGDQWSDLMGGNCGFTFKLPNVRYLIP